MPNNAIVAAEKQSHELAPQTRQRLVQFVFPLLVTLNQQLDVRLVRTFLATLEAIVQWRNRAHGLLLSELGAYLASPDQAPAGTKRLSTLLRSPNWAASLIEQFLWSKASAEIAALRASGEEPLAVWDESVLEKLESAKSEGLCAVRSSKAHRLKRVRPGFFNPPAGRPICVAGLHWLGLLITSRHTTPVVAAMEWWTTRGERASDHHSVLHSLLARTQQAWGRSVRHVFDRGFANGPWLHTLLSYDLRFVLRWKKRQKLLDGWAELRKAWEIARGKRTWSERLLRDTRSGKQQKVGIVVLSVNHPYSNSGLV